MTDIEERGRREGGPVLTRRTRRATMPASLANASPVPFWLDRARLSGPSGPDGVRGAAGLPGAVGMPGPLPPLDSDVTADLAVIGGGFTGLWTALLAKERDPGADVVLVEGRRIAWAGTGRNGGLCSSSLTHGLANGLERFGSQIATLERLGRQNLDEIEQTVARHGIDCDFERTGELAVATRPWQLDGLARTATQASRLGADVRLLDARGVRDQVSSPAYLGGLWDASGCATIDPARLAWGLRRACLEAGVRIYEHTPVTAIGGEPSRPGGRLALATNGGGTVLANRVALAAGAFAPLLRRLRYYLVPVYDYALTTRPLTQAQLDSVGWRNRQGVGEVSNNFHYYRLTGDNRILWGGHDAVYHYGSVIAARLDQRPVTFATLAATFYATFPQLDGLEFTHAWGGVIDTCTRSCAFFGTARSGRLAYAAGYTGRGVGASRFGANVMLDLLAGQRTERTELRMVRTKPLPYPPEPARAAGIGLTRWSMAQADRHDGRRNLWLRTLDNIGPGFDG